jgi:hypothetical protein
MTLLKALELLKRKAHTYDDEYCFPKMDCKKELDDKTEEAYQRLLKALTELEELKRYPTSEEVCEAIQEDIQWSCQFEDNQFKFIDGEQYIVKMQNGRIVYNMSPTPKTNYLIIRFYEGVGK